MLEETVLFLQMCCYKSSFFSVLPETAPVFDTVCVTWKGRWLHKGPDWWIKMERGCDFCSTATYLEVMHWHFALELVRLKWNAEFNTENANNTAVILEPWFMHWSDDDVITLFSFSHDF